MIKHTVCFKLKKGENVKKAADILRSMRGNVSSAIEIEVGEDFLHSERSFDLILQVTLKDRAALDEYQNDPYHCSVVKKHMHAVREASVAIDCEL